MSADEIIDKLKKLMLKEESCRKIGNLAEASLYAAKITEWCMRYKIELSSIQKEDGIEQAIGQEFCDPVTNRGKRSVWWQNKIARDVCTYTGCCHCIITGTTRIIIIGKEVDRQLASYLIRTLCNFIAFESQKQYDRQYYTVVEKNKEPSWLLKDYKANWIHGAVTAIHERLEEMREKVENDNPGSCVALVLRRDCDAAREWLKNNIKTQEHTVSGRGWVQNAHAHASGYAAGQNVSLSRPLGATATPQLGAARP